MNMKLQINDSGGWRNVMSFDAEKEDRVRFAAQALASLGERNVKLRILDADGNVTAHHQPGHGWETPAWASR